MLAETVSLDGDLLLVILVILIVLGVATIAVIALGCVLAVKAARGSANSLAGWFAIAALEGLVALTFVPSLFRGHIHPLLVIAGAALAGQIFLYVTTKASRG